MRIASPAPVPAVAGTPATQIAAPQTVATEPPAPPARHIDQWNERPVRGANRLADGEVATVGASTFRPLIGGIPGYRFRGGLATAYEGVEMVVEDGGQPAADVFRTVAGLIDASPARVVAQLAQLKVEAGQDDAYDRYFERAYGIPGFKAVAASGSGHSIYFGGRIYAPNVFFHELGHVAGGLIPWGAWQRAIAEDNRTIAALLERGELTPVQMGAVEPDPARRERWAPRLQPGGVTGYAQSALKNGGTPVEDECESLSLRTRERYFNTTMATFRDRTTGETRPIGFAELYPSRARVLAGLGPAVADVRRGRTSQPAAR